MNLHSIERKHTTQMTSLIIFSRQILSYNSLYYLVAIVEVTHNKAQCYNYIEYKTTVTPKINILI
jgi:hypothetical protein